MEFAEMEFIVEFARKKELKTIELLVNQRNKQAITFYEKFGLKISESRTTTYDNGHSEDDHLMRMGI